MEAIVIWAARKNVLEGKGIGRCCDLDGLRIFHCKASASSNVSEYPKKS